MVRSVVGDEAQVEAHVDSLFVSRASVQVGLLVGKLAVASSRDLVFALIPTPAKDGEEVAKITSVGTEQKGQKDSVGRKGGKGKPSAEFFALIVDIDWVAEHARQVSRMLLGGMDVVGVFVFAAENTFKLSTATLWQAVRAVGTAAPVHGDGDEASEHLLLHISSSPRRLSCRSCALDSSFSATSLRPCEWKLGKLLSNLHTFVHSHKLDIRVPVVVKEKEGVTKTLRENLFSAIALEAGRLKSAIALVDGSLPVKDKVLGAGRTADGPHAVELLLPVNGTGAVQDVENSANVAGMLVVSGVVHARAFASIREPLQLAISDLKDDVIASLKCRLEVLFDEVEQAESALEGESSPFGTTLQSESLHPLLRSCGIDSMECSFALPRRVLVPWHDGALFCDYMLPDETLEVVQDRCTELFAIQHPLEPSSIVEPEASALPSRTSFCEVVGSKGNKSSYDERVSQHPGTLNDRQKGSVTKPKLSGKEPHPVYNIAFLGIAFSLLVALLLALIFI